jgi:hypothetical protein
MCWYTAMLMLARWSDTRLGLNGSESTRALENIVLAPSATRAKPTDLFSRGDIPSFCSRHGMRSYQIAVNPPDRLKSQLVTCPVGYVGIYDAHFQHTVVLNGMTERQGLLQISFNDPNTGRREQAEYFDFLRGNMPAFSDFATIVVPRM